MLDLETTEAELCAFQDRRGQIFKRVMPSAMRNIAIAQQRDIERYRRVRGGGWDRPKAKFAPGDYVLLRQAKHTALEPIARPHVLRIVEIRPSGYWYWRGVTRPDGWSRSSTSPIACFPSLLPAGFAILADHSQLGFRL